MHLVSRRRLGALVMALGLLGSLAVTPVFAGSIVVNTFSDAVQDIGNCTLREAIIAANTDTASGNTAGECAAGSGADTITFSVFGIGIGLSADLPTITSDMSIQGGGGVTRSAGTRRQLMVAAFTTISGR